LRPIAGGPAVKRRRRIGAATAAGALLAVAVPAGASPAMQFGVPQLESSRAQRGRIEVRFMGTSTILLDDGVDQILIDGFFTRPNPFRFLFGRLQSNPRAVQRDMRRADIVPPYRLRAVLVAHAHFDHVLDAPAIAHETGAWLVGSESTAFVGRGAGLPEAQLCIVENGDRLRFGAFTVSIFWSHHSRRARYQGPLTENLITPARASSFRDAGSFAFLIEHGDRTILIHPSAEFELGMYGDQHADLVFLSVGQLGLRDAAFARRYWDEVVIQRQADLVVPIHWDIFMLPVRNRLWASPWPADNVGRAMRWLRRFSQSGPPLGMMRPFEPVAIDRELPAPVTPRRASTAAECNSPGPSVR